MTLWTTWSRRALTTLGVAASIGGSCGGEPEWEWELVWADEFSGAAGEPPDPARWTPEVGTDWGNGQLEFDTDRASNAQTNGQGQLEIIAREESFGGRNYTSARLSTEGKFEFERGRFEARIRLPGGQGIWPAFWLLGSDFRTVGWPECGEIDIMEFRGQEPNTLVGSLHGPGYSGGAAISGDYESDAPLTSDFHVYKVEWTRDRISWFIDDVRYHFVDRVNLTQGRWVFDNPFFVILNVAVGGSFMGPPNDETPFPAVMQVDWVRVYRGAP